MANKKIPFKYARPVEEWLQEKGNFKQTCFFAYVFTLLIQFAILWWKEMNYVILK